MRAGSVRKKVEAIREELAEVDEPHWGSVPDWELVWSHLKSLIESGHTDEVIDLRDELFFGTHAARRPIGEAATSETFGGRKKVKKEQRLSGGLYRR